jgi:hypothetical protein
MAQPKAPDAPAANASGSADLKKLAERASTDAKNAQRANGGTLVAGPFDVGEIGHVSVIERTLGQSDTKYLYAEFTGQGRPSRVPLAAVTVLAEKIA